MKGFGRFVLYVGFLAIFSYGVYDNYLLYGKYTGLRETEASILQEYNRILIERDESKPTYYNNTDIASAIAKAEACHLQKCYVHLKGETEPISIDNVSDISQYSGIEYIEYVVITDSVKGISVLKHLDIPVNDIVVNDGLVILSVPSLEI